MRDIRCAAVGLGAKMVWCGLLSQPRHSLTFDALQMFARCQEATSTVSWRLPRNAKGEVDIVDTRRVLDYTVPKGGCRKAPGVRRGKPFEWLHKARAPVFLDQTTLWKENISNLIILLANSSRCRRSGVECSASLVQFKDGCLE